MLQTLQKLHIRVRLYKIVLPGYKNGLTLAPGFRFFEQKKNYDRAYINSKTLRSGLAALHCHCHFAVLSHRHAVQSVGVAREEY